MTNEEMQTMLEAARANFADGIAKINTALGALQAALSDLAAGVAKLNTVIDSLEPPPPSYSVSHNITAGQVLSGSLAWIAVPSDVAATQKVEFRIDNVLKWTENISPYHFNGDGGKLDTKTLTDGMHSFEARAYKKDGLIAEAYVSVTVKNTYVPPPPSKEGFNLPAKFHIWGGNERTKALECDFVCASFASYVDPRVAKQTNPGLVIMAHPNLSPYLGDYCYERGFAWTYGAGLAGGASGVECRDAGKSVPPWPGVSDALAPNPLGAIRGFTNDDWGLMQSDGNRGFAWYKRGTADWFKQVLFYCWKVMKMQERDWDGLWSDNLFPGNLLAASWAYDEAGRTVSAADWDANLVEAARYIREKAGIQVALGGNVVSRSNNAALCAAMNAALIENAWDASGGYGFLQQGPDVSWSQVQEAMFWTNTPTVDGSPRYLALNALVPQADTQTQRFVLGFACIVGASMNCYDGSHEHTYWPPEITKNGQRGYLGKPITQPARSGGVFSREYEHGRVTIDFANKSATFA